MGKRIDAIKTKYSQEGLWPATKEVPVQGWDLAKENKWKTVGGLSILALATAYFMSPAYKGFVHGTAKEAAGFFTSTIPAWHGALVDSMPGFIGTDAAGKVAAGVIMIIAAAAAAFVLYKGAEKICTYLTDAKTAQVNPPQQQSLGGNNA